MGDPPLEHVQAENFLQEHHAENPLQKGQLQLFFEKVNSDLGVEVDVLDFFDFLAGDPIKDKYINVFASNENIRFLVNKAENTPNENLLALVLMAKSRGITSIDADTLSQLVDNHSFSYFTIASIGGIWSEIQSAFGAHTVSVNPSMEKIEAVIGQPAVDSGILRINNKLTPANVAEVEEQIGQQPDIEMSAGLFEFGSGLEDANGIANSAEAFMGHAQALLELLKPGGFLIVRGENDILEKVFFKSSSHFSSKFSIIFDADDRSKKYNQSRTRYLVIQKN